MTTPDPIRVLFVTPRFWPYTGGVETHVYQVARRLASAGVEVMVLTTDLSGRLPVHEQRERVTIRRARAWPAHRDYYFAPGIYRAITRGDWDVVHVQSYHTLVAPLAMFAALRARLPYLVTFHGGGHSSQVRNALRGAQRAMLRPLLARAERLIAVAQFEVEFLAARLRLPRQRFVVIPNGSDLPPAARPAAVVNGTLIASVGRLERYKGHHRLIEALPKVLEQRPDAYVWIAGAGPYEPALRRLADRLGVADRVEIRAVPAEDRQAMASALSSAALVVLLSEYETHPIAVLEAMRLKRPVLVARTSGLTELAERGLARAIPIDSTTEQVALAVLDQLRRPLVPANVDLPSWDDCVSDLLTLYRSILRERRCAS